MYAPTAQLIIYFNNLHTQNQTITLVVVAPPSGWQHSSDDGRVVTKDMTLRPSWAATVAARRRSRRQPSSPHRRSLPCFSWLSLSLHRSPFSGTRWMCPLRRHNTTGNNGDKHVKPHKTSDIWSVRESLTKASYLYEIICQLACSKSKYQPNFIVPKTLSMTMQDT